MWFGPKIKPIINSTNSNSKLMVWLISIDKNKPSKQRAPVCLYVWLYTHTIGRFINSLSAHSTGTDILQNGAQERSGRNVLQSITKIDLGAQSQLLANPGQTIQIHYEITNLRNVPMFHNFQVVDEQRFLRTLNPVSWVLWIEFWNRILMNLFVCQGCGYNRASQVMQS